MDILKVKVNNQWVGIPAIKGDNGEKGDKGDTGDPAPAADITSAVNTWLSNNISNPDSPPLDRTLTSNVSTAPADMVGDLKQALTNIDERLSVIDRTFIESNISKASGSQQKLLQCNLIKGKNDTCY